MEYSQQGRQHSQNWEEEENTSGEKRKSFSLDKMGLSGHADGEVLEAYLRDGLGVCLGLEMKILVVSV